MSVFSDSKRNLITWNLTALAVWTLLLLLYQVNFEAYVWLGTEDKAGENMTSVLYFGAGILLLARSISLLRSKLSTFPAEILTILLALFFIFVGGEEISWGQRLFGIETPEAIRDQNVQGEITLHNLKFFDRATAVINQHTALNLIAFGLGLLVPLAHRYWAWARTLLNRVHFPVQPLCLAGWFVVGLLHGQTIAKMAPHWAHTEIKELVFSFGFFLFGVAYFKFRKPGSEVDPVT